MSVPHSELFIPTSFKPTYPTPLLITRSLLSPTHLHSSIPWVTRTLKIWYLTYWRWDEQRKEGNYGRPKDNYGSIGSDASRNIPLAWTRFSFGLGAHEVEAH